jgi:hypothetical protein
VLEQSNEARVGVDLEPARLYPVGERERPGARDIMPRRHQLGLEAGRQRIGPEIRDARHFVEAEPFAPGVGVDHDAVADVERLGVRLQDRARDREHVRPQRLAGLPGGLAADAGRARCPGAASVRHIIRVARDDAHLLERHTERCGDALRDHGLGALALLGDAARDEDRAGRIEPHRRAVLR